MHCSLYGPEVSLDMKHNYNYVYHYGSSHHNNGVFLITYSCGLIYNYDPRDFLHCKNRSVLNTLNLSQYTHQNTVLGQISVLYTLLFLQCTNWWSVGMYSLV